MKFYKVTNEEENHNGMNYHDGLNIDIIPFNPSGDCESGGIYFSREDIFRFLSYGPWIREVTIPENEEVYENPGEPKKWKSHRVILGERRKIDLEVIKELVEEGASVHVYDDYALVWAARHGYLDIVEYLASHGADINVDNDFALMLAADGGHLGVVEYLVEQGANVRNRALILAANGGYSDVVEYLESVIEKDA